MTVEVVPTLAANLINDFESENIMLRDVVNRVIHLLESNWGNEDPDKCKHPLRPETSEIEEAVRILKECAGNCAPARGMPAKGLVVPVDSPAPGCPQRHCSRCGRPFWFLPQANGETATHNCECGRENIVRFTEKLANELGDE